MNRSFAFKAVCLVAAAALLAPLSALAVATPEPEAASPQEVMTMQPAQPMQTLQPKQLTPEQQADRLYTDGMSYRDKAEKLEKEAASQTDAKKREKLEAGAREKYQDSIKKFAEATKKNPSHYSAWGNLGLVYGKTGDYTSSLDACQKAIEVQPNYTPAIECRGEAYLALNRLDEVKAVYTSLWDMDRPRADELAAAIDQWIARKKADPSGLDPAKVEDFAQWVARRRQLAS